MDFKMAVGLLDGLVGASLVAYAIVLLALTTSMNIAELLGLRWKRVNLSGDSIVLGDRALSGESIAVRENYYRGVFGTVKQKSRNRDLPIPRVVLPVLRRLMDESSFKEPDNLVFRNRIWNCAVGREEFDETDHQTGCSEVGDAVDGGARVPPYTFH